MSSDRPARFAGIVDLKTRQALAAMLQPFKTVEVGATIEFDAIGNPWTRRLFDEDFYARLPATSLVFVQSSNFNTHGIPRRSAAARPTSMSSTKACGSSK